MTKTRPVIDGRTILIAEDDPDDRLIIERAFDAIGFSGTLYFVENGEQLVGCLPSSVQKPVPADAGCPACILVDLNMPLLDGRQAIRHIRRRLLLDDISVVVLTTSESESDKEYCLSLGATAFITKPPSVRELAGKLAGIKCIGRLAAIENQG